MDKLRQLRKVNFDNPKLLMKVFLLLVPISSATYYLTKWKTDRRHLELDRNPDRRRYTTLTWEERAKLDAEAAAANKEDELRRKAAGSPYVRST